MQKYDPHQTLKNTGPLVYPIDANPEDFFPECIRFGIHKREGNSLEALSDKVQSSLKTFVKTSPGKNVTGVGSFIKETAEALVSKAKSLAMSAEERMKLYTEALSILNTNSGNSLNSTDQITTPLGSIYLNMPSSIQFSEGANWAGQGIGVGGDQAMRMASGGDTSGFGDRATGLAVGNLGNIVGGTVGSMIGALTASLGGVAGFAVGAFAGENLQRGFERGLSIKQNPYMEMMFEGIGFRAFRFDFVLRPRGTKEVESVMRIIKAFREYSRPSWNPSFGGTSFMNYPMEFQIQFLTLDDSQNKFGQGATETNTGSFAVNEYLPKLKPCVLSSVETNYTPQSIWAAHDAGVPVAVTLGLSFQETELVMAEDIQRMDGPKDDSNNPNSSNPETINSLGQRMGGGARQSGGAFTGG